MQRLHAPMTLLLSAGHDGNQEWTLVSVLVGEAVLRQRDLLLSAHLRDLVARAVLAVLPAGTVCAVDGAHGFALAVALPPVRSAALIEPALRGIAVITSRGTELRVTPVAAVTRLRSAAAPVGSPALAQASVLLARTRAAAMHALERGDLRVVLDGEELAAEMTNRAQERADRSKTFARAAAARLDGAASSAPVTRQRSIGARQITSTYVLTLVLPFVSYLALAGAGIDVLPVVYPLVVVSLVVTAAMIVLEGLKALLPTSLPPRSSPEPAASALVVAYLPNEAAGVLETIHNLLEQDYAGGLQVILAYNTPMPLPVERDLERLAAGEPRFTALRVEHSTSKAANVNAALSFCTGEFVGIFDADHLPAPGSFARAWRWLQPEQGNDVVQGHCVVRDGTRGRLARTVALEFEAIYAVSHPGRARIHDFGIFGGSNGYWRTTTLHAIRMHEEMLTEDIDSTARLLLAGGRIVSDPGLISTELAPASLRSLWAQRMRWAQGWHQVSRRHLGALVTNRHFTLRQRAGAAWLFGWREVYPWISLQSLPILAAAFVLAGPGHKSWVLPLFVMTTLFTVINGPLQVLIAWRLAVPELRGQRRWWLGYLLVSVPYAEMKNLIGRVAQVKEFTGERHWQVTSRPETTRVP